MGHLVTENDYNLLIEIKNTTQDNRWQLIDSIIQTAWCSDD